jgi:uncharacterized damage-inducible protein DinB
MRPPHNDAAKECVMPITRPGPDEFAPYYGTYINKVPGECALTVMESSRESTARLLAGLSEEQAAYRYAPGKWSLREVIGHLADSERIFAYRMLRFARKDETPLASFDENAYMPAAEFERRPLAEVAAEFRAVRDATLALARSLDPEAQLRRGIASGKVMSVRALAWTIAGHEIHHLGVLKERYLGGRA